MGPLFLLFLLELFLKIFNQNFQSKSLWMEWGNLFMKIAKSSSSFILKKEDIKYVFFKVYQKAIFRYLCQNIKTRNIDYIVFCRKHNKIVKKTQLKQDWKSFKSLRLWRISVCYNVFEKCHGGLNGPWQGWQGWQSMTKYYKFGKGLGNK